MNRIVVTGAAGIVGQAIRPFLRDACQELVLADLRPIQGLAERESYCRLDVSQMDQAMSCLERADAIVHLAGLVGPDYGFEQVLAPNIVGTYNILEAARRREISRIVFASSHHAVGFYERQPAVDHLTPPRPDSFYGFSKACGESLASLYADKYDLNILAIRIGYVGEVAIDERRVHTWTSPRDLAQLIQIGLTYPDLGFQIVYGASKTPDCFFDNSNAEHLGYRPEDDVHQHLSSPELLRQSPEQAGIDGRYIGGHFVTRHLELKASEQA